MYKQSPSPASPELSTTISRGAFALCTLSHPVHLRNLAPMTMNKELKSAIQCHKKRLEDDPQASKLGLFHIPLTKIMSTLSPKHQFKLTLLATYRESLSKSSIKRFHNLEPSST